MYYIVYGLLYTFSLLPLRVLYIFSDFSFFLVYYIIGYRKKVVKENLRHAFPEKTVKERNRIARKFYRNFTDTFIETIKMISVSDSYIQKRFKGNWEVLNQYYDSGRSIQICLGHNFNWEWANTVVAQKVKYLFLAVYMPLSSKIMDRLFQKLRSRTGTVLLPATKMREAFLPYRDQQYILGLAADQSPGNPSNAWWFDFLGRPAGFVKGPEKGARTKNTIVVFAFIHKQKRGHYEFVFSVAEDKPLLLAETELTKRFVCYLENVIREYPDMWLWSHRRWKYSWKPEYGEVLPK